MSELKEYLERIENIANSIEKVEPKWKDIIYSEKDDGNLGSFERELEDTYFSAVKAMTKNNSDIDDLNKKVSGIVGKKVFVRLCEQMHPIIWIFENTYRISMYKNPTLFIIDCFDKVILRRDPDFIRNEWANYGFESERSMLDTVKAINNIVWSHTSMSFCKNAARNEFMRLTDLDETICSFYAEKYDGCFDKLQAKMLLKTQNEINNNIRSLMEALTEDE